LNAPERLESRSPEDLESKWNQLIDEIVSFLVNQPLAPNRISPRDLCFPTLVTSAILIGAPNFAITIKEDPFGMGGRINILNRLSGRLGRTRRLRIHCSSVRPRFSRLSSPSCRIALNFICDQLAAIHSPDMNSRSKPMQRSARHINYVWR
jgi:hypothetical protein